MENVTFIFINTVSMAAVGFLLKLWIDKRLSHSLNQELESFKSSLAKEISLYSIQNTLNHTKKMELLDELYVQMLEMDTQLKILFLCLKADTTNTREGASEFCGKYTEFNACLHRSELFLEESLVGSIRDVYEPYFYLAMGIWEGSIDSDTFREALPKSIEKLSLIGDKPRKEVVNLFREAAGIN